MRKKIKVIPNRNIPLYGDTLKAYKGKMVDNLMGGRLNRFLRKHYKQYHYTLVYSKVFPRWEEERKTRRAKKWILRQGLYPQQIIDITNILITLNKHFEVELNRRNIEKAYHVWKEFSHAEIYDYMFKKRSALHSLKGIKALINPTKKAALKEQKARGFIGQKEFAEFDETAAHVYSNINRKLIYPENFFFGRNMDKAFKINIYIGLTLVGVPGWTRSELPK